jgi:hypothetical protein
MIKSFGKAVVASVLSLAIATAPVVAQTGVVSFTGGSTFTGFSSDETVGWRFTVGASSISVISLGWWDQTPATDLAATHQVGIWTLGGTLLGSTTVQTNSALTGDFRYEAVTAFTLNANTSYLIGGRDLLGDGDNYISSVANLVTGAGITFNEAARSENGTGFAAPTTLSANTGGRFGANFQYRPTTVVPEPSTYALLGAGLAAMAVVARRRRTA